MNRSACLRLLGLVLLVSPILIVSSYTAAQAATRYVANNGVDPGTCAKAAPCRSINQAILVAVDGDKIVVGPGHYKADVETPAGGCVSGCLVHVNKRVTITSRDGASVTVLDAEGAAINVVEVSSPGGNGAVFGKKSKGFKVINGANGVNINSFVTDVRLTGNVASGHTAAGFELDGDNAIVTGNQATGNAFSGFSVRSTGHSLVGNVATGNTPHGFAIFGSGHELNGNIATDNASGFTIFADSPGNISLTRSEAIGNSGPGVAVGTGTGISVASGNIYNNDPAGNCGLSNSSGNPVSALKNFWGAATGPGADPADNAGGTCDTGGGTDTSTFATKEYTIKPK